jgi:hypothetical protein
VWHDVANLSPVHLFSIHKPNHHTMNKKLLALGLVAGAAWLFKTKKGNEVRSMLGEQAGKLGQQLKDEYAKRTQQVKEQYDETMA